MSIRLATGPDSWGVWFDSDPRQPPWFRFLDEVVLAGYDAVELGPWGYLPTDDVMLRRELEDRGLELCGGTVLAHLEDESEWPSLRDSVLQVGQLCASLNAEYLVLIDAPYNDLLTGARLREPALSVSELARLVDTVKRTTEMVGREFGITVVFHPHAETHIETEEQVRAVLEATTANEIRLCLDTGHVAYTGGDPLSLFADYHDRITCLHLKDVNGEVRERVAEQQIPFVDAVAHGVFCKPGDGVVDFERLASMIETIGYSGWAVVEHDMYPADHDVPLPIAIATRQYLSSVGL